MYIIVKVVGREVKTEKGSFVSYALLNRAGKWYGFAGENAVKDKLADFTGRIAKLEVERAFTKTFKTTKGVEGSKEMVVVKEISKPTEEEVKGFESDLRSVQETTLKNIK